MRTVGPPEALAIAGNGQGAGDYVVALGGEADGADIVWLEGVAEDELGTTRVIAQDGTGLWRRAPWPVNDELFELPVADRPAILVVGSDEESEEIVRELDNPARADFLTRDALEAAGIVVFAQAEAEPLPARAFAVLAARRILIMRPPRASFGLEAGINYLSAGMGAGLAELATSTALHWEAFAPVRSFARITAEAHRASAVYARLAFDLAAEAGSAERGRPVNA
jgi:hypothetical protein